ncbi:DUF523 domain-containing protein [Sulfurimonas paralvinellae]|uniref:DUF523 domain-containing protein n=1 Tax=Sulfurimonas paralvinellae TaxID=317658 RepID=A0A7M1B9M6_9BACT|nr:DUF523 domain-containing protein [Sulfurimonas paralvinellae]QOP46420.1 DUF523 domain-containing protein [Sulfurimonas paralvinellae]
MSSAKKKAIISACILGEYCRYDGKTKKIHDVVEAYKDYEIIPFCPEAPLFGTPRERINVVDVDGKERIITDETNRDVTELLREEIESFCKMHPQADAIVLKSKSPSCGYGTTPILDSEKNILRYGNGIAATILEEKYKDVTIKDELL